MSLPITPVTAAAAVRLAGSAVSQIGQSLGFDQILQGQAGESAPVNQDVVDQNDAKQSLIGSIRDTLAALGLPLNPPPQISLQEGGRLQIDNNIPQAAQIEAALNADPGLRNQASQLRQLYGGQEVQLRLSESAT